MSLLIYRLFQLPALSSDNALPMPFVFTFLEKLEDFGLITLPSEALVSPSVQLGGQTRRQSLGEHPA